MTSGTWEQKASTKRVTVEVYSGGTDAILQGKGSYSSGSE